MRNSVIGIWGALVFGAIVAWAGAASAQSADAIEQLDKGLINWSQGYVQAVGVGAPSPQAPNPSAARLWAERAAKADGYRNLLETVRGVRVDAETTVENYVTTSDVIRTRVDGIVRGATVVDKRYMSDGAVELTLRMPLQGDLTGVMLEQVRGKAVAPGKRLSSNFSVSAGSYEDALRSMQMQRESEEKRKREAEAELQRLEAERKQLEAQRKADAERKRLEELEAKQKALQAERESAEAEKMRLDQLIAAQEESRQTAALPAEPAKPATPAAPAAPAKSATPAAPAKPGKRRRKSPARLL